VKDAAPNLDQLSAIHADGSRRNIVPADVHGRFLTGRRIVYAILIAIYVLLPFVHVGGHPALQLDIVERRFYLFGAVFNAQDTWRGVFLLLTAGTAILFLTTWYGRIWCGWACPQTVFLEGVYRRIERWLEGAREHHLRRDAGPLTMEKIVRKATKHAAFFAVSLILANVAIAFFVSLPSLGSMIRQDPRENWVAFSWVMTITALLYANFAWFREQLCIVVCPYGRLQSALLDKQSVIIGYDVGRGEPRGRITRAERSGTALPVVRKGDCVDCGRCVAVCPTAIDIRNGTQMECIGCAQCIDACDDVMARLSRPKGLIRYDSLAGLQGEPRRTWRARLVIYGALVVVSATALVLVTALRTPFEANIVRVTGAPYVLDGDTIRNQYELHLVNKNPVPTTFHVDVSSSVPMELAIPARSIPVGSLDHFRLPIFVTVKRSDFRLPFELHLVVKDDASGQTRTIPVRFLGPLGAIR
jgi:cytochrome c oxidase accessory protein FixG